MKEKKGNRNRFPTETGAMAMEIDALRKGLRQIVDSSSDAWAVEVATNALRRGDQILFDYVDHKARMEAAN